MNFEQLTAFVTVAETCSIRKAGEQVYMSPQNVSRLILQLEKECGEALFDRTPVGMQLTSEGKKAYQLARKILYDADEFKSHFNIRDKRHPQLRTLPTVIYSSYTMHRIFSTILNRYYAANPKSEISYYVCTASTINKRLNSSYTKKLPLGSQMIDIAITNCGKTDLGAFIRNYSSCYQIYHLFDDRLALEIPSSHPFAKLKVITKDLLENNPIFVLSDGPEDKTYAETLLERHGIHMNNINRFSEPSFVRKFASLNGRLVIVSYPSSEYYPIPNVTIVPIEGNIVTATLLLVSHNCFAQQLIEFMISTLGEHFDIEQMN